MKLKPPADIIIVHPNGNTTEVYYKTAPKKTSELNNSQLEVYKHLLKRDKPCKK